MHIYETVVIVKSKLSDTEVADFIDKTKKSILKGGGEILSEDRWGRRKFAYPIKASRDGFYFYLKYQAPGVFVDKMGQQMRITEDVLRSMTTLFPERKAARAKAPKAPKKAE
ncbi:MAG: 30S ribosomal protein S6 [Elusimicrobiota bacterium]